MPRIVMGGLAAATICLFPMTGSAQRPGQPGGGVPGGVPGGLPGIGIPGIGLPGQMSGYPSGAYYTALRIYRDGDLESAIDALDAARRATRTDISGKWIDSIPVLAMIAECQWHLGDLAACRETTDEVIRIAVRNRGWLGQIRWDDLARGGAATTNGSQLWPEANLVQRMPLPRTIAFASGQFLTEQRILQGGAIETPNMQQIDAVEMLRCLAVVSHRRRMILGPLSDQEPMGAELVEAIRYPANLVDPAARMLIGATRGAAYFAIQEDNTAFERINRHATAGPAAHPLTPIVSLCGLQIAAYGDERGVMTPQASARVLSLAQQIVNVSAALEQYEWIGEAMQLAAGSVAEPQLAAVEQSALLAARTLVRESRLASLHCYLAAADAAAQAGRIDSAAESLQAAATLSGRRDVQWPRLQAYGAYVSACVATARGGQLTDDAGPVAASLMQMNDFIGNRRLRNRPLVSMPWNYQLGLVNAVVGRSIGNQSSRQLIDAYSSGASLDRWRRDPVDALASHLTDTSGMHLAIARLASLQNDGPETLIATDRVLAARFANQLPLQGRCLQVRSMLSRGDASLSGAEKTLLQQTPGLATLRTAVGAEMQIPPAAQADDAGVGIATATAAGVSVRSSRSAAAAESQLGRWALRRMTFPSTNPPPLVRPDIDAMPESVAIVTFLIDDQKIIATSTIRGASRTWTIPGARRLPSLIARLMQDIGASRARGPRLSDDEPWRDSAAKLKSFLFPADASWSEANLSRVIVVPDGPMWYLPFELLPIGDPDAADEQTPDWGTSVRVQYSPTPGFAWRHVSGSVAGDRVAIVTGNFFAPRDNDTNATMLERIQAPLDRPLAAPPANFPPTDRLGLEIGHLIVAAPVTPDVQRYLATPIVPVDTTTGRPGGVAGWDQLQQWMRLPAGGPRSVILPGYRTAAVSGKLGDGGELFFAVTALRAAGVEEVLISRWATGGQSASILVGELAGEVAHTGLAEASSRGISILRQSELSPSREPLLGAADADFKGLTGSHPLFWSSYLTTACFDLPPPASEPNR